MTADGTPIGQSPLFRKAPGFRNALVQSIAGGNTMVMNRAAFAIVRQSAERTSFVSHDWWCYMLVTGAGGRVIYSAEPHIGYRQHAGNVVGTNAGIFAKLARIRGLFGGRFAGWNARNIEALLRCRDLLRDDVVATIEKFDEARRSGLYSPLHRALSFRRVPPDARRQSRPRGGVRAPESCKNRARLIRAGGAATEGHHPGGWQRHAPLPDDTVGVEADPAGLRQADGVLSTVGADARRHPRNSRHLDAAGPAGLPEPAG